ncbi:uncharacterized protein LOC126837895 [Adelges cooleyi]|uniref:uncharacterized protein LOC126837895 n=1 Tax=Adelges cooleyi TaxID=133065 RepID=UPI00217F2A95|nr:uncharacterized protein LOC126837895 [Adelges cooleyi]
MFFNFSLLLLFFVITASCRIPYRPSTSGTGDLEDEIIEHSFKDCIKWLTNVQKKKTSSLALRLYNALISQTSDLTLGQCVLYMGNDDLKFANEYFDEQRAKKKEPLNLEGFVDLFKHVCKGKGKSVQECAEEWETEEGVIVDSFIDCKQWYNRNLPYLVERISCYTFASYMKLAHEDDKSIDHHRIVSDFMQTRSYPNFSKDPEFIDLNIFGDLFKNHCGVLQLSIKECAKLRREATLIKKQKEIENRRRDGRDCRIPYRPSTSGTGDLEDEIIEHSFKDCRKWFFKVPKYQTSDLTLGQCVKYMGKNPDDLKIANDYFKKQTAKKYEPLNLEGFVDLFKHVCKGKRKPVQECAEEWETEEGVIEDSFIDCRQWFCRDSPFVVNGISHDAFSRYMMLADEDDKSIDHQGIVNDFIQTHTYPNSTEYSDFINLKIFGDFFKNHCGVLQISIKECAKLRREATLIKKQKEIESRRLYEAFKEDEKRKLELLKK